MEQALFEAVKTGNLDEVRRLVTADQPPAALVAAPQPPDRCAVLGDLRVEDLGVAVPAVRTVHLLTTPLDRTTRMPARDSPGQPDRPSSLQHPPPPVPSGLRGAGCPLGL